MNEFDCECWLLGEVQVDLAGKVLHFYPAADELVDEEGGELGLGEGRLVKVVGLSLANH